MTHRALVICGLVGLGCFYVFTLVYLSLMSVDFIYRGRIEAILSGPSYQDGQRVTITQRRHFIRGWSGPEPSGVWSIGRRATIAVSFGHRPDGDLQLSVQAIGFTAVKGQQQVVDILANGHLLGTWRYDHGQGPSLNTVRISRDIVNDDGLVLIDFRFCCPERPRRSRDARLLGLHLVDFRISVTPS